MKIGITERSDPSLNFSWIDSMKNVNGAIIISKNLNEKLKEYLLFYSHKVIFHHTITGFGGTFLEPNIYGYMRAFEELEDLINKGFPKEQVVIRIDPMIPTDEYFNRNLDVIKEAVNREYTRIRFSFLDMYPHVKNRFRFNLPYTTFNPSKKMIDYVLSEIKGYSTVIDFESCCEHTPYKLGCISQKDLTLLKLNDIFKSNPFRQRPDCLCHQGKTELIKIDKKQPCAYKCIYCYWKG